MLTREEIDQIIHHDLKQRFNSPTVNLYIPAHDYIYFLENLEVSLADNSIIENITNGNNYPIGLLNNQIHLHFVHYDDFNEAVNKWRERAKRINYRNLYIILAERDGCTHDILKRFDDLQYPHKIAIVHKEFKDIACAYKINGYEKDNQIGIITNYDGLFGKIFGKRGYDKIDWVQFLNEK